ncbi:MAG: 4-alpha-glucanotransferase [Clostridia bacterium]|nr:4-alpha-glucanotransferase [Clostridia bacterium]
MNRESGILFHISSLPNEYGCGSFGKEARDFVDFLKEAGFGYWQVLPFCPPDPCGSPYKSVSAFAGNSNFIDLDALYRSGLLTREELDSQRQKTPYLCDFKALKQRDALFMNASRRVSNREEIEVFVQANPMLDDYCHFMALKAVNQDRPWWEFSPECTICDDTLFMHKFIQYTFFSQWKALRTYANENGIRIIGDMPIYVDIDSADVYANRENFLLDERNNPTLVAGVPPDYFAPEGQLWGNPLYDWNYMKRDGYSWWKTRMAHTRMLFDGVRIDHFRAFSAYYAVEADAENAKNGTWMKGPGLAFIEVLKEAAKGGMIIAEDLGDIDDDVRQLVEASGFPGMRVFQFGFDSDDCYHRPHAYIPNCVAYSGTHDNNTLLGYLWELELDKKKMMLDYVGVSEEKWQEAVLPIVKCLMRSSANLVIFPLQDILAYGRDTRMNTPGVDKNNWAIRFTREQIDSIDRAYYRSLNLMFERKK